jgi:hypothetical protein
MAASTLLLKHLKKVHAARARKVARMTLVQRWELTAAACDRNRRASAALREAEEKRAE